MLPTMRRITLLTLVGRAASLWTPVAGAAPSPPRSGAVSAYDEKRGRLLLFGGYAEGAGGARDVVNDLWIFEDGAWRCAQPATPREDGGGGGGGPLEFARRLLGGGGDGGGGGRGGMGGCVIGTPPGMSGDWRE